MQSVKQILQVAIKENRSSLTTQKFLLLSVKMMPDHISFGFQALILVSRWRRRLRDRQRRKRRYWVHPITSARIRRGVFETLFPELRNYPDKFFNYLRMTVESFDDLLQRVSPHIQRQDTTFRRCVSPAERLLLTIRFLASEESFSSLHFQFRLGISTVSIIVKETCRVLWDQLHDKFIPHPTRQHWSEIAEKYWDICQFPNCIGAVDGKHIRIITPQGTGSEFHNYKKYFSIILMAIADAEYRFVAVDVGAYGRTNDSMVFKNSYMGRSLYNREFDFPQPQPLPGTDAPPMPFVLVGDEAFQMCGNLLKPYSSRGLN
ncbi:protein ALP1-like [Bufo gargarizans]|uniref:protein ALP1-like n=1 Tax=Bufo gargarizans TaxID=30331 RepID=UPI001CF5825A|nr:protein ALP1-like [Bufo gargarizans]